MNQAVQPYRKPEATPVGHSGIRVDISERPAWAITGWAGVLLSQPVSPVLFCSAGRRGSSRRSWSVR